MLQRLIAALVVVAPVFVPAAYACNCETPTGACQEVAAGSMVFIGTVDSISPRLLDHWNLARRPSLADILTTEDRYMADGTAANLNALKQKIRDKVPEMSAPLAERLSQAMTLPAVEKVFDDVLSRGRMVRFNVKTLFAKGGDDDDKSDSDDDDDDVPESIEIATPFGDCGYNFQQGETYLVYAGVDEDTNTVETSICTATKRLSDAGEDLPYLYFYKDSKQSAGELTGVARYDERSTAHPLPAPGLVIGVQSGETVRYTTSGSDGRFVFDGLADGLYQVRAWSAGYPDVVTLLAQSEEFEIGAKKACVERTLLVPRQTR